jgi:nucleotide-binding universal stress UspA family protein
MTAMLKFQNIVCPVDFSEFSTRACDYAYSLAKHYGAKLYFEHVVQPLTAAYPYYAFPDAVNQIYWNLGADAEERLREMTKGFFWNGTQPQFAVHRGLVPESILNFAGQQKADLIVMGTHGRQGLDRLTMGSVTEKVLRKARCPVLAVRKPFHDFVAPADKNEPVHLKKIIYATDFSDYALRALDYALSLAMEYNSELTLLHVLEEVPEATELQAATARAIRQLENPIPKDAENWCKVKPVVRLGKPYQEIIQLALESEADLIVLGVRGRNAVDLALFGSTTHRVLQLGSTPVLAVHM